MHQPPSILGWEKLAKLQGMDPKSLSSVEEEQWFVHYFEKYEAKVSTRKMKPRSDGKCAW